MRERNKLVYVRIWFIYGSFNSCDTNNNNNNNNDDDYYYYYYYSSLKPFCVSL